MYPFLPARPKRAGLQLFSGCRPNIHKSTGWTSCQQLLRCESLTSFINAKPNNNNKKKIPVAPETKHHAQ